MPSTRLAFAALAVACIGAAAAGGYLATRQNSKPVAVEAGDTGESSRPTASPAQEAEATVGQTAERSTPALSVLGEGVPEPSQGRTKTVARQAPAPASPTPQSRRAVSAKAAEPLPTLERSWPGGASVSTPSPQVSTTVPASATPSTESPGPAPKTEERPTPDTFRAPEGPSTRYEEMVVSADSVIGLQAETSLSSETARLEDRVEARVTRDVRVRDTVAIPSGTRAIGSVVSVERGGRFKERARLGIRFNALVLADGTRLPISTETIYREGDAPGKESASKIGGATVGGAILGAIIGGAKGAAIGATAGAGAGTAAVMSGDRQSASLRSGQTFTVRILAAVPVTIERK